MDKLLTYCGLYAGTCSESKNNAIIHRLAVALADLVDANNCDKWMPHVVKNFKYTEFRKGLEYFGKQGEKRLCEDCCSTSDYGCFQYKGCPFRTCCRNRKVEICFECDDFPCKNVKNNPIIASSNMMVRYKLYKKLGYKGYLQSQKNLAKKGYEHHTGKFYKLLVIEKK